MKFKTAGDKHFMEDGSSAEITVDLLLTAGARIKKETESMVQKTPPSRR